MANTHPKQIFNVEEDLDGVRDGVNNEFTTSSIFVSNSSLSITVFRSGVKQKINSDYNVVDGGTGYDTVIFKRPPRQLEHLTCIYIPKELFYE